MRDLEVDRDPRRLILALEDREDLDDLDVRDLALYDFLELYEWVDPLCIIFY